jgi:hydrogenase maturation protease
VSAVRTRVLGIGSPCGDDRVGWLVASAVGEQWRGDERVEVHCLDRPGPDLLRHLHGPGQVLIVDAVRGAAASPGKVWELSRADLAVERAPLSGHEMGVAAALELLDALGGTPATVRILGVGVGAQPSRGATSAPVAHAVPRASGWVSELIRASLEPAA